VALPESEGQMQIIVVVHRFSKMAHIIVLSRTASTNDTVQAILREVWKLCGFPEAMISDQDTKWTTAF
jgi:hypothetical protein